MPLRDPEKREGSEGGSAWGATGDTIFDSEAEDAGTFSSIWGGALGIEDTDRDQSVSSAGGESGPDVIELPESGSIVEVSGREAFAYTTLFRFVNGIREKVAPLIRLRGPVTAGTVKRTAESMIASTTG